MKQFYEKIKDWDFSNVDCESEYLTKWDMYELLKENVSLDSRVLDLGTGGGEKLLKRFPNFKEIIGTDYSKEMIKTANENLEKSERKNISFLVMDNLKLSFPKNYFDAVIARHTVTDAKQIYDILKEDGTLFIRGVDALDCHSLKRAFKRGQGYGDLKTIGQLDYEQVLDVGFSDVELVPIHVREYYKTKEDLLYLLYKTPIINEYNSKRPIEMDILDEYISKNTKEKGIIVFRRYYGISAKKRTKK